MQSQICAMSLAAKTLHTDKHTGLAVVPDAQKWTQNLLIYVLC